ncbi:hypothetical protein CSPX01_14849 [Colletotrichum filicis]|nr:hypothetical protein CSPX01_14849 [Colletotrichum filicis]
MHTSTISTLGLLLSLPLAAVAQSRCQSDTITTDKDKEYSAAVNFDSASKKYTATVPPGDMSLTIPALSITNNGGYKRLFCLASEPDRPRSVDVINATAKVGVKTFIPSDFGTPKGPNDVPEYRAILRKKAQAHALLEEKAKEDDKFTWTSFWNGSLLNRSMALFPKFGFDLKNHSATIYDSGNESFTAMSIGRIGKPIAAVFKHPEETKTDMSGFSLLQPHSEQSSKHWRD